MSVAQLAAGTESIGGSRNEPPRMLFSPQLSTLVHMRLVLAPSLSERQDAEAAVPVFAEIIKRKSTSDLGGLASVTTEHRADRIVIAVSCLPADALPVARRLIGLLEIDRIDDEDLTIAKARVIHMLQRAATSPMAIVRSRFLTAVSGKAEQHDVVELAKQDNDRVREVIAGLASFRCALLSVVGPVPLSDISHIRGLLEPSEPKWQIKGSPRLLEQPIEILSGLPTVQDMVRVGCGTIGRQHPDYAPVQVGVLALGGFPLSRLTRRIRESEGIAYAPRAFVDPAPGAATFGLEIDVDAGHGERALTLAEEEFWRVSRDGASLDLAKGYAVGAMELSCSSGGGFASVLAGVQALGLPIDWLSAYELEIAGVDLRALGEVFEEQLHPTKWGGVVVRAETAKVD